MERTKKLVPAAARRRYTCNTRQGQLRRWVVASVMYPQQQKIISQPLQKDQAGVVLCYVTVMFHAPFGHGVVSGLHVLPKASL